MTFADCKYADLVAEGLAGQVRVHRERLGCSKRRLAKLVGIEPSYVTKIESGEKVPSVAVLVRIAFHLRIPPSRLFADAEQFAATFGEVGWIR